MSYQGITQVVSYLVLLLAMGKGKSRTRLAIWAVNVLGIWHMIRGPPVALPCRFKDVLQSYIVEHSCNNEEGPQTKSALSGDWKTLSSFSRKWIPKSLQS